MANNCLYQVQMTGQKATQIKVSKKTDKVKWVDIPKDFLKKIKKLGMKEEDAEI